VSLFQQIVEQKIAQAERDGAFANLPGAGRPLMLEDLSGVPEELRASYILLKTHGFVPPELEAKKEWLRLEDLLAACADTHERCKLREETARAALRYRLLADRLLTGQRGGGPAWLEYREQVLARLRPRGSTTARS
jgi:hypothetical protein